MTDLKMYKMMTVGVIIFAVSFYLGQNWDNYFSKSNSLSCPASNETNVINLNECVNKQVNTMIYMIENAAALLFTATIISPQPLEMEGTTVNQPSIIELLGKDGPSCSMSVNDDFYCSHPLYESLIYHNAGRKRVEESRRQRGIIK